MFTTAELDNYVNEAAHGYLKETKPLNETITKLASEHGLNRDQIARVVEGANTEVYVQLMNQSTDKYVQFENASLEKIGAAVFGTAKQAEYSMADYEEEPTIELVDPNFEKLATVEETIVDEAEMVKQAYRLAALDGHLTDSLYEVDVRFQKNSSVLYELVKQAYLGGTSFGDIQRAITTVYDSPVVNKILTDCREKIANEIFPTKLEMGEKVIGSVNLNNPLIKQAGLLVKDTQEFITLKEKVAEVYDEMEKLAIGLPQVKAYFKTVGKALSGQKVRTQVVKVKEIVKATPKVKPAGEVITQAPVTVPPPPVYKPMTKMQKGVVIGGTGAAGGMLFQSHIDESRTKRANMPMLPDSGRFRG